MIYFYFKVTDSDGNIATSNTKSTSSLTYVTLEDFLIGTTDWALLTDNSLCTLQLYCKGHYALGRATARQKDSPKSDHIIADEQYEMEIEHDDATFTKRKEWRFFKGLASFEANVDAKMFA